MIQMKYSILSFCILALSCRIVMIGCGGVTPSVPLVERETIVFEYVPIETAVPGSADVTFAVVDTQVNISDLNTEGAGNSLFNDFANSMTKDFIEILTARGFGVRGPFDTYDEMNFPDKKDSDFILTAKFEITPDMSRVPLLIGASGNYFVLNPYKETIVSVKGRIDLVLSESLTNERMWTKSVPITPFRVSLPKLTELPRSFWHTPSRQFLEEEHEWSASTAESLLVASGAVPPDWSLPVVDVVVESPYRSPSDSILGNSELRAASIIRDSAKLELEMAEKARESARKPNSLYNEKYREEAEEKYREAEEKYRKAKKKDEEHDAAKQKVEARRSRQKAHRSAQVDSRFAAVKNTNFIAMLMQRNAFHNSFGLALQSPYREIMNKTFGYLNPEEMALLKRQSQELRKRKVY